MATEPGMQPGQWVLLSYRIPREPSTPRIAVWRALRRLGVVQLGDGLVALPADARTREQLEWVAEQVTEANGTAGVWLAQPTSVHQERELATTMAAARSQEYLEVAAAARGAIDGDAPATAGALRRLRAQLRRISRRDYFPPVERDAAYAAVSDLATVVAEAGAASIMEETQ